MCELQLLVIDMCSITCVKVAAVMLYLLCGISMEKKDRCMLGCFFFQKTKMTRALEPYKL